MQPTFCSSIKNGWAAFRIESSYFPVAASGLALFICLIGTAASGGNPQCLEEPEARELQLRRLQGNSLLLSFFAVVFWLMLRAGLQSSAPSTAVKSTRDILEAQNSSLHNQRILVAQQATTYLLLTLLPATALTIFMSLDIGVCLTSDIRLAAYGLLTCLGADMLMRHIVYPFGSASNQLHSKSAARKTPDTARMQAGTGEISVSAWGVPTCLCIVFSIPPLLSAFVDARVGGLWLIVAVVAYIFYGFAIFAAHALKLTRVCSSSPCSVLPSCFTCSWPLACKQRMRLRYSLVRLTSAQRADGLAQWRASFSILILLVASMLALLCYELGLDFKCAFEFLGARRQRSQLPTLAFGSAQVAAQLECEGYGSSGFFGAERLAVIVQSVIFFSFLIQLVFMVVWERIFLKLAIATHKEQAQQTTAMLRWLSHECRSPVAAAMLSMDYILQDCLPEVAALLFEKDQTSHGKDVNGGLFGHASRPVGALSPTASPTNTSEGKSQADVQALAAASDVLSKVHTTLVDLKGSMDLVVQPLTSLSQVLDNMLLYMRRRNSAPVSGLRTARMDKALNPLAAWKTAWQNASASHDIDGDRQPKTTVTLSVNASHGLPVHTVEGGAAVEECLKHCSSSSSATQATLLQVLTNYLTNAMKYGKLPGASHCEISVSLALVSTRSVLALHGSPKQRKRIGSSTRPQATAKVGAALPVSREASFDVHGGTPPALYSPKLQHCTSTESQNSDPQASLTSAENKTLVEVAKLARDNVVDEKPAVSLGQLTVATSSAEPGVLLVTVQDWGRGMSETDLLSLFQPFSRLRSGATLKGNGLGLWLMKELVETQGAKVSASSPGEGLGCSFSVFLPIKANFMQLWQQCQNCPLAAAGRIPADGRPGGSSTPSSAHSQSKTLSRQVSVETKQVPAQDASSPYSVHSNVESALRILVVDDSPANRSLMVRQLKRKGFWVDSAEDGTEGLARFQEAQDNSPYRLIISDMTMPVMNGDEFAEEVFKHIEHQKTGYSDQASCASTVFIGVTGNTMEQDIEAFLSAGAHKVLSKPVSVAQILECFQAVLDARKGDSSG